MNPPGIGPQVLVLSSIYQGNPFWAPMFDLPFRREWFQHLVTQLGALFTVSFLVGRGFPTKIDYRKKGYPYSNLSTGGPSQGTRLNLVREIRRNTAILKVPSTGPLACFVFGIMAFQTGIWLSCNHPADE